ncbi:Zn-ribbon domain-containing OB-fold protein [Povalibacter sp.]|uniref:Zn-ribbon domain-containing OB-fold protein n=1 Tax=Povalibacter sp. TaxID=1962978 RepID=UPI002F4015AE
MSYADLLLFRSPSARPYWDAARYEVLQVQECMTCSRRQFYPRDLCHHCWSTDLRWIVCSGKAVVHSYTVCHVAPHPDFTDQLPLVIAIVDLEEGVRMTTNIVECDSAAVRIGMAVEAVFDHVTAEATLVKFRPVKNQ